MRLFAQGEPKPYMTYKASTGGGRTQSMRAKAMVPIMIFSSRDMGPIWRSFSAAAAGASGVCVISGGASLYSSTGVINRPMIAGTKAAYGSNQREREGHSCSRGKETPSLDTWNLGMCCSWNLK